MLLELSRLKKEKKKDVRKKMLRRNSKRRNGSTEGSIVGSSQYQWNSMAEENKNIMIWRVICPKTIPSLLLSETCPPQPQKNNSLWLMWPCECGVMPEVLSPHRICKSRWNNTFMIENRWAHQPKITNSSYRINDDFIWIVLELNLESAMHLLEFNQKIAI